MLLNRSRVRQQV